MSKHLLRLFQFEGYETTDVKFSIKDQLVRVILKPEKQKPFVCYKCTTALTHQRARHALKLKELSIMGMACFVELYRRSGHCPQCKKSRAEQIDFISQESPHMTERYAWLLGQMCEFAATTRVAKLTKENHMTVGRVDYARLRRMLKAYKIPPVEYISVDEVYAYKKPKYKGEKRDRRFFTVISDLITGKVIWVSQGRDKKALDEFFQIIGPQAAKNIKVVAMDQQEAYRASVKKYCRHAMVVWDRFHLVQSFNEVLNDARKEIFQMTDDPILQKLLRPKNKYIFLKKASKRTASEKQTLHQAVLKNSWLLKLELIKERLHSFFRATSEDEAWDIFDQIGDWVHEIKLKALVKWWDSLERNWDTLRNYFRFKASTALSEGINNVIKVLKRRAYGYTNIEHFKLKILQVCGYLNSDFIKDPKQLNVVI